MSDEAKDAADVEWATPKRLRLDRFVVFRDRPGADEADHDAAWGVVLPEDVLLMLEAELRASDVTDPAEVIRAALQALSRERHQS